jgi:hypothetical protein
MNVNFLNAKNYFMNEFVKKRITPRVLREVILRRRRDREAHSVTRSTQRAEPVILMKNTPRVARCYCEATTGLEPVIGVLQTLALPTWLRRLEHKS